MSATTYYASAKRFCRQYRAANLTATYASYTAAVEAYSRLQSTPWKFIPQYHSPAYPVHAESADNPADRDYYDAYLMCAEHADTLHRAYAGLVAYRIELPDAFAGASLTSLSVSVSCDPYTPGGARLAIATSAAAANSPSSDWDVIREGSAHADGQAPRTVSADGTLWYGATATATVTPAGGLALGKYLWVYLSLENYERARNGWLEGAAKINPTFTLVMADAVAGYTDGDHIGGGYETPSINLATADVPAAPRKVGTSTISTWPTTGYMPTEVFGTHRVVSLTAFPTPETLATFVRETLVRIPGNLSAFSTASGAGPEGKMYQNNALQSSTGWSYSQFGLSANVKRADSTTDYIQCGLSHYILPFVPLGGFTPSSIILTNGSSALDLHGAAVQVTPWFIEAPCDLTTKTLGYYWFAMRALAAQASFWLGDSATVAGTVDTLDSTPVTYSLSATRMSSPVILPDTLAVGGTVPMELSFVPVKAGFIILVPWIVSPGILLSSSVSQVGLGSIVIVQSDSFGITGAGWLPGITLE